MYDRRRLFFLVKQRRLSCALDGYSECVLALSGNAVKAFQHGKSGIVMGEGGYLLFIRTVMCVEGLNVLT